MHRRRPGSVLASLAFPAALIAFFAASQVSLAPDRPTPEVGEFELDVEGNLWTSEPIRVDATAIALTWEGDDPALARVRASEDGEVWGEWTDIHDPDDHGPDPGTAEGAHEHHGDISEAIYVGDARWLQFRIGWSEDTLGVAYVDTSGRTRNLAERIGDFLGRIEFAKTDVAAASPDQPPIHGRDEWGGDQCREQNGGEGVEYHDGVAMMFVHHTVHSADSNGYDEGEVADLLYAICSFHVGVRGWVDIGYNALIDKYGRIWEGREGGLDQSVQGAHTGGFNSYSTGVAFLGDFSQVIPTPEAEQALVDYASWKLNLHHVDPRGEVTVESFGSSRWEAGTMVTLSALSGHKDASLTACPGEGIYYRLEQWAELIADSGGAKIFGDWQLIGDVKGSELTGYTPTTFPFHFSEEMDWTLVITDPTGAEVFSQTGSGTEGSVTWDGTFEEANLAHDVYTARLEAFPVSGESPPLPAVFDINLGSFTPPFSDDEGSVHEEDIVLISATGITTGCAPEMFCPKVELNRWQMALFLTRLHAYAGFLLPIDFDFEFSDTAHLPPEYQQAIGELAALGVTLGTGPEQFDPEGIVSREQMALFLTRWLQLAGVVLPDASDQGFTDIAELPVDHQIAINQLAQLGITTGTAEGVFSPEIEVTREQMASFIARSMKTVPDLDLPTAETGEES